MLREFLPCAGISILMASAAAAQETDGPALSESYHCIVEPHEIADVGSQTEGILAEVLVERGANVKKGDILARLHSEVEEKSVELAKLRAENDAKIKSSRQRSAYFQAQDARSEKLYEEGSVSSAAAEKTRTERQIARYELESALIESEIAKADMARAIAMLEQKLVRSPFDGIIVDRMLSPGAYTYEQAPVFRIAQVDPLNVEVYAPTELFPYLSPGMVGEVTLPAPFSATYEAEVAVIDKIFDAASSTFGVRLSLPNQEGKIPAGLHCKVKFLSPAL